jgi:hypothetical protein
MQYAARGSDSAALTGRITDVRAGTVHVGTAECAIDCGALHWEKQDGRTTASSTGSTALAGATALEVSLLRCSHLRLLLVRSI